MGSTKAVSLLRMSCHHRVGTVKASKLSAWFDYNLLERTRGRPWGGLRVRIRSIEKNVKLEVLSPIALLCIGYVIKTVFLVSSLYALSKLYECVLQQLITHIISKQAWVPQLQHRNENVCHINTILVIGCNGSYHNDNFQITWYVIFPFTSSDWGNGENLSLWHFCFSLCMTVITCLSITNERQAIPCVMPCNTTCL